MLAPWHMGMAFCFWQEMAMHEPRHESRHDNTNYTLYTVDCTYIKAMVDGTISVRDRHEVRPSEILHSRVSVGARTAAQVLSLFPL